MAKGFISFEMSGLKEVLSELNHLEKAVIDNVDGYLTASANIISRDAKRAVPKDTGGLSNAISATHIKPLDHGVVAQKHYGPYVEFGTGGLVDVPVGLEDYAIQFKGQGIREVNLPARPFLFPAYEEERKKLIEKIKKSLIKDSLKGITIIRPGGNNNITGITTV
ncbi:HK97-gp10 family putative phage morphogenesis protein [Chitinophaga sp. MM2321]|uniref:HK97-gp10 family putative phage morphogenesis protein n=1 Tax=Chitinophaga sp. MM2321 TaxID=3137178 RepID=UPI0032D5890D